MASSTASVDNVEFKITRLLEWLRAARSDWWQATCLALRKPAGKTTTSFNSKTQFPSLLGSDNVLLKSIFTVLRNSQTIVWACTADALSKCLCIMVE